MKKREPNPKLQAWIVARRRHRLSHAQVQMARELGMSPKKFGGLDNHDQESWKIPLPQFIESLYLKRFGKERPDVVLSIEQRFRQDEQKAAVRRERKKRAREQASADAACGTTPGETGAAATDGRRDEQENPG